MIEKNFAIFLKYNFLRIILFPSLLINCKSFAEKKPHCLYYIRYNIADLF